MDKVALVTGAAGGIGAAICTDLKSNGYFVIGTDKGESNDLTCDYFVAKDLVDLCRPENLESFKQELLELTKGDGISCLVSNAAVQILKSTEELDHADWEVSLSVNLLTPFYLAQSFLNSLEKHSGSTVNISSVHAVATKPNFVCYATTKAALAGLTKAMAVDLGSRIRINAINPTAVATPMLIEGFEGKMDLFEKLAGMHPVQRIAEPSEVASLVSFLVSPKSSFMTGSVIDMDGGILSRLHDPDSD